MPGAMKYKHLWKSQGRCVQCGARQTEDGKAQCEVCLLNQRVRRAERKANGLCVQCSAPSMNYHCARCSIHRWRMTKQNYQRAKAKVRAMYGSVCACCGESEIEFLTIDHINGDGAAHRRALGQTRGMSRTLLRWLLSERRSDIQMLCYNCNCSKRVSGVCPHEMRRRDRLKAQQQAAQPAQVEVSA